jgi:hypothetical protein
MGFVLKIAPICVEPTWESPRYRCDGAGRFNFRAPAATMRLFEVKTISPCKSWYRRTITRVRQAVDARARTIHAEYVGHCRGNDRTVCGTQAGTSGPFEDKLNTFPAVVGLVVGGLGELNDACHSLISIMAEIGAAKNQRRMLAPSWAAAKSALTWQFTQRLGFCALRGVARLKLTRALYVGSDGARRASAEAQGYRNVERNRCNFTNLYTEYRSAAAGFCPTADRPTCGARTQRGRQ